MSREATAYLITLLMLIHATCLKASALYAKATLHRDSSDIHDQACDVATAIERTKQLGMRCN